MYLNHFQPLKLDVPVKSFGKIMSMNINDIKDARS